MSLFAPLDVAITTRLLELRAATDERPQDLAPLVEAGRATADPHFQCADPTEKPDWRGAGSGTIATRGSARRSTVSGQRRSVLL